MAIVRPHDLEEGPGVYPSGIGHKILICFYSNWFLAYARFWNRRGTSTVPIYVKWVKSE